MRKLLFLLTTLVSLTAFPQCGGDITFTTNPQPSSDGTYPPNTTIELCVTMTGWDGNNQGSNWMEGFGLTLGAGWVVVNPTLPPNDADNDASGTWLWVENVTSDATGLTAGPGYFFEGPTGPLDGNPGNDWGDYCMNGDCIWTFCVELTTSGNSGDPLNIEVQNFADGTMGSWNNNDCVGQDPPEIIYNGSVGCSIYGCIDPVACNYNINASCDDGNCDYFSMSGINPSFLSDTVCVGLEIIYSVTGDNNSTYNWDVIGGEIIPPNELKDCRILWGSIPGTYTITVQETTETGCVGPIESYDVEIITPDIVFDTTKYSICLNQSVLLNAYPIGGEWNPEYMNESTFVGTNPGTYYPTYTTNIYGCDITENVEIEVRQKFKSPDIIYSSEIIDLCLNFNNQTYVAEDSIGITYRWFVDEIKQPSTENYMSIEWYDTTQTYIIKVIAYDILGCESEPKLISVRTESCQKFFAPNSFTPNGDGTNDIFEIRGLSVYRPTMKIFNRWGDIVYTSSNLWWTGDSGNGYYCDNGVYNWIVEYKDKYGFNKQESGFVTLIR